MNIKSIILMVTIMLAPLLEPSALKASVFEQLQSTGSLDLVSAPVFSDLFEWRYVKESEEAEKTAKLLNERILAEIKQLNGHPWAGEYYSGDGLGVNESLSLSPTAGFVFEWHGCLGLYDRNYGSVTESNGTIRLSFTFKNEQKGFQGLAEQFIPVTWGDRHYLIPSDHIVGFCNAVNGGSEPRTDVHGVYFLRRGDEKKMVTGSPVIPAEYKAYLLAAPVSVEITGIGSVTTRQGDGDWKIRKTTVFLSAGRNKGLLKGMKLHVTKPKNLVESAIITKVEEASAEAVMTQDDTPERQPERGWRLSTRYSWK